MSASCFQLKQLKHGTSLRLICETEGKFFFKKSVLNSTETVKDYDKCVCT